MKFILLDMVEGLSIFVKVLLWIEVILILISLILYIVLHRRKHQSLIAALAPFIIALLLLEGNTYYAYLTDPITIKQFEFMFAFKFALALSVFPMFTILVISIVRYFYGGSQNE